MHIILNIYYISILYIVHIKRNVYHVLTEYMYIHRCRRVAKEKTAFILLLLLLLPYIYNNIIMLVSSHFPPPRRHSRRPTTRRVSKPVFCHLRASVCGPPYHINLGSRTINPQGPENHRHRII